MSQEPSVDFVYPDDELHQEENHYREAAQHMQRIMNITFDYIVMSKSPERACYHVAYALGLALCEGVSMTDRSAEIGESVYAFSKSVKELQHRLGINTKTYTYGHNNK